MRSYTYHYEIPSRKIPYVIRAKSPPLFFNLGSGDRGECSRYPLVSAQGSHASSSPKQKSHFQKVALSGFYPQPLASPCERLSSEWFNAICVGSPSSHMQKGVCTWSSKVFLWSLGQIKTIRKSIIESNYVMDVLGVTDHLPRLGPRRFALPT